MNDRGKNIKKSSLFSIIVDIYGKAFWYARCRKYSIFGKKGWLTFVCLIWWHHVFNSKSNTNYFHHFESWSNHKIKYNFVVWLWFITQFTFWWKLCSQTNAQKQHLADVVELIHRHLIERITLSHLRNRSCCSSTSSEQRSSRLLSRNTYITQHIKKWQLLRGWPHPSPQRPPWRRTRQPPKWPLLLPHLHPTWSSPRLRTWVRGTAWSGITISRTSRRPSKSFWPLRTSWISHSWPKEGLLELTK